jgi:uncharacterized membrane protein
VRAALVLSIASTLALWGLAVWLWPQLPERIPMHFDVTGVPDRIVERTPFNWFLLPALGTAVAGLLGWFLPWWLRHLARKRPTAINLPDRELFLKLSAEERERSLVPMCVTLRIAAVEVTILFAFMLVATERVAVQAWQRLPMAPALVVIGLLVATVLAGALIAVRATRRNVAAQAR